VTNGIEHLTIELIALQETKRQVEGALRDARLAFKETRDSAKRRSYEDDIADFRKQIRDLNKDTADRERRRRHCSASASADVFTARSVGGGLTGKGKGERRAVCR
jgi:hypothetical protein